MKRFYLLGFAGLAVLSAWGVALAAQDADSQIQRGRYLISVSPTSAIRPLPSLFCGVFGGGKPGKWLIVHDRIP